MRKKQSNLSYLSIWDCLVYVRILNYKRVKIINKSYEYVFIEYVVNNKAYNVKLKYVDINEKKSFF